MAILQEKEIRGFQLKNKALVCPVCASDEEKAAPGTELIAEDAVHDPDPMYCTRCKKKIA